LAIWARDRDGKLEKVDNRDSEHLLQEYRGRFSALEPGEWTVWRGGRGDEPNATNANHTLSVLCEGCRRGIASADDLLMTPIGPMHRSCGRSVDDAAS
jgi:hypothetical protein